MALFQRSSKMTRRWAMHELSITPSGRYCCYLFSSEPSHLAPEFDEILIAVSSGEANGFGFLRQLLEDCHCRWWSFWSIPRFQELCEIGTAILRQQVHCFSDVEQGKAWVGEFGLYLLIDCDYQRHRVIPFVIAVLISWPSAPFVLYVYLGLDEDIWLCGMVCPFVPCRSFFNTVTGGCLMILARWALWYRLLWSCQLVLALRLGENLTIGCCFAVLILERWWLAFYYGNTCKCKHLSFCNC